MRLQERVKRGGMHPLDRSPSSSTGYFNYALNRNPSRHEPDYDNSRPGCGSRPQNIRERRSQYLHLRGRCDRDLSTSQRLLTTSPQPKIEDDSVKFPLDDTNLQTVPLLPQEWDCRPDLTGCHCSELYTVQQMNLNTQDL